jgi:hypothetical protein
MGMDYKEKSDLVKQLAQSMGMQGERALKAANFDAGTGTLYVGSTVYLPEQIESARLYCLAQMEKYKPLNDATYQMFEIAATSIALAQKLVMSNKGRIVITDDKDE